MITLVLILGQYTFLVIYSLLLSVVALGAGLLWLRRGFPPRPTNARLPVFLF